MKRIGLLRLCIDIFGWRPTLRPTDPTFYVGPANALFHPIEKARCAAFQIASNRGSPGLTGPDRVPQEESPLCTIGLVHHLSVLGMVSFKI